MLVVFLGFIALSYFITVITEETTENIPSEFNYSPEIMTIKSKEAFIANQF